MHVMAHRLIGAGANQCWRIVHWTFLNKLILYFNKMKYLEQAIYYLCLILPEFAYRSSACWIGKIDTCNGLSPVWCQAISWTNADLLFLGPFWINSIYISMKLTTWNKPFITCVWHCRNLHKGLVPFELVQNWYIWWLVTCLSPHGYQVILWIYFIYCLCEYLPL